MNLHPDLSAIERLAADAAPSGASVDASTADTAAAHPHSDGDGPTAATAAAPSAPDRERSIGQALRRGWNQRCPCCGGGPVFDGYLTVRDECMVCGQALHHHRADDMPAWITILVVAHLIVPMLLLVNDYWAPQMWVHMVMWPIVILTMTLVLLPRFKAMVVALQWCTNMGGFGGEEERPC
ncbi:MAG: hypothetical protein ACJA1L_001661 [Paracoccaceae bacterium]|jgi:uncharacterized protein (DUF983 family)